MASDLLLGLLKARQLLLACTIRCPMERGVDIYAMLALVYTSMIYALAPRQGFRLGAMPLITLWDAGHQKSILDTDTNILPPSITILGFGRVG